jgi:hypothetical protein
MVDDDDDDGDCVAISRMNDWQGKPKHSEKTCPSVALPTTDPIRLDAGSNPGHRVKKPATDRQGYGTAEAPHYG